MKSIHLVGVRQNNLQSINVSIPLGSFTTICGPSGSGKSSLAFETLYAEGQRRYIESLSNYSKQFLNKAPKPDVEFIENIPPAISIEQKNGVRSSRSTVGTTTEVLDYLRLLYEKVGVAHCPHHEVALCKDSPTSAAQRVLHIFGEKRGYILAPVLAKGRFLQGKKLLAQLVNDGFMRLLIPKRTIVNKSSNISSKKSSTQGGALEQIFWVQEKLGDIVELEVFKSGQKSLPKKDFYIVMDRLGFSDSSRLIDSLSQAFSTSLKYNKEPHCAQAKVLTTEGWAIRFDERYSCSICDYSFPEIDSRLFSFNSPIGACEKCKGFGNLLEIDPQKVIPNQELSLTQGALKPFSMPSAYKDYLSLIQFCNSHKIDISEPWGKLSQKAQDFLWSGHEKFLGVMGLFHKLEKKKYKMHVRVFLARYKSPFPCESCEGTRLKVEARQVLVGGKSIAEITSMSIEDLYEFIMSLHLTKEQKTICQEVYRQMISRLQFLNQVGLGYITLNRPTSTLSGGEYQRIMLSNQLGMELSQTLYVLDEPTIGLHPRDNTRLIHILHELQELGNTLVVVEHDQDVIQNSSHIIEMGPGSGHLGGKVIFSGKKQDFYKAKESNTVEYLITKKGQRGLLSTRPTEIKDYNYTLDIKGCQGNNLQNIDLSTPLHRFVTVTGVSGSGKSSLISQTLYPALAKELKVDYKKSLPYMSIHGFQHLNHVLFIDQSPISTSARSQPATYLKVFDAIRSIMARTDEACRRGYTASTFSLNTEKGRCPVCKGLGFEVIDMVFMDDLQIICEACGGSKYRDEVLEIVYNKKNINDILSMTVSEAMVFFISHPSIRKGLSILKEVGLDYIQLGQPSSTLSGGESQRLKIAREFNSTQQKGTLYILDEPTTGLHFREIELLIKVLNRLIEGGGSVLVIEHNLELIRHSDYIIDIGPEAGQKGGQIIAQGSPDKIMKCRQSHTGQYLLNYV